MIYGSMVGTLHNNLQNLLDIQRQMATERKYHRLSDNPSEIARALSLQSSMTANAQFVKNQSEAIAMLRLSETAMNTALDIVHEIRELVIQAGNGALDRTELEAISTRIDALKQGLLDTLNTRVAGRYIFGGTDTTTRPFVMGADGQIRYVGSDQRIRYQIEEGLLSDVSFTGGDLMPNDFRSYFICSHFVPLDWEWSGREEKVLITVGNRTLSVFIPEHWIDEVATGSSKPTDYNQFRDPEEVRSISLDDLAMLVNRSLREQGADMLVTATVQKNFGANQQRLIFKSNTGEPISVTGWPTTDPKPMPQSIAGLAMDNSALRGAGYWSQTMLAGNRDANFAALAGTSLTVIFGERVPPVTTTIDMGNPPPGNMTELLSFLNDSTAVPPRLPSDVTAVEQNGKLALVSSRGENIKIDGTSTAAELLFGSVTESFRPKYSGLMGNVNTLGWRGDGLGKAIEISIEGEGAFVFELNEYRNITELVNAINKEVPRSAGDLPFASIVSGRLVLQSSKGQITVRDVNDGFSPGDPRLGGTAQLFGQDYRNEIKSSTSSLTLKVGEGNNIKIFMNEGDDLARIAERINAIEGVFARTSVNGSQLVVVAQQIGGAHGSSADQRHFPPVTLWSEGMAMTLFDFSYSVDSGTSIQHGVVTSREQNRPIDHSHIDVFRYLNMETSLKSREFKSGETLTVGIRDPVTGEFSGEPLHWRIISGTRVTEIRLNPGEYTMEQLTERLRNAGAGWLDVTLSVFRNVGVPSLDDDEIGLGTSANREEATSRLVIQSVNGSPVSIMDMNGQRYAEEMGLSTALRSDENTGVTNIRFPSAACLDSNLPAAVRVQMTCGKTYDVRLARRDIVDRATGFVDRVKVMDQIARQVNAQAGHEVLRLVIPVDNHGRPLPNSASLIAVTGEPFSVVDLPILDPRWNTHTAGIAAQMGIHGGVTSIPAVNDVTPMRTTGTIRFETLGRSVEIDVSANDTVQTIMDRLRSQAGDWLYVNYFDADMSNNGNFPIISIAARDGSPVNVIDVQGGLNANGEMVNIARDVLRLNTSIQGNYDVTGWSIPLDSASPQTFSITVAGFTHTIDLTAMRDINGNGVLDANDLVATINARMQAYDVRAEINRDGFLVLWSPRGYSITIGGTHLPTDVSTFFTEGSSIGGDPGDPNAIPPRPPALSSSSTTPYRGGYDLENPNRQSPGIFTQNVVTRSGANQMQQNFFGVLNDISAAVRAENRNGLSERLLPMIDRFMDNLLRVMSTSGALEARYESNIRRMRISGIIKTEAHEDIIGVNLAELSTQLLMAQTIYQASLGIMSYIVQPTLLNFLR